MPKAAKNYHLGQSWNIGWTTIGLYIKETQLDAADLDSSPDTKRLVYAAETLSLDTHPHPTAPPTSERTRCSLLRTVSSFGTPCHRTRQPESQPFESGDMAARG